MEYRSRDELMRMIRKISDSYQIIIPTSGRTASKRKTANIMRQIRIADKKIVDHLTKILFTGGSEILRLIEQSRMSQGELRIWMKSICIGDFAIPACAGLLMEIIRRPEPSTSPILVPALLGGFRSCDQCGFSGVKFVPSSTSLRSREGEAAQSPVDVQSIETELRAVFDKLVGQAVFDPILFSIVDLAQKIHGGLDTYSILIDANYLEDDSLKHVTNLARIGLRPHFIYPRGNEIKEFMTAWEAEKELKVPAKYTAFPYTPCPVCGGRGLQMRGGRGQV